MTNKIKGEWIKSNEIESAENYIKSRHYYKCSVCGYEPRYEGKPIEPVTNSLFYCPYCGTKMKK